MRIGIARRFLLHLRLQLCRQIRIIQHGARMGTDHARDDELQPRQTDAMIGQTTELESQFRIRNIQRNLEWRHGHLIERQLGHLHFEQALIHLADIAIGA